MLRRQRDGLFRAPSAARRAAQVRTRGARASARLFSRRFARGGALTLFDVWACGHAPPPGARGCSPALAAAGCTGRSDTRPSRAGALAAPRGGAGLRAYFLLNGRTLHTNCSRTRAPRLTSDGRTVLNHEAGADRARLVQRAQPAADHGAPVGAALLYSSAPWRAAALLGRDTGGGAAAGAGASPERHRRRCGVPQQQQPADRWFDCDLHVQRRVWFVLRLDSRHCSHQRGARKPQQPCERA